MPYQGSSGIYTWSVVCSLSGMSWFFVDVSPEIVSHNPTRRLDWSLDRDNTQAVYFFELSVHSCLLPKGTDLSITHGARTQIDLAEQMKWRLRFRETDIWRGRIVIWQKDLSLFTRDPLNCFWILSRVQENPTRVGREQADGRAAASWSTLGAHIQFVVVHP